MEQAQYKAAIEAMLFAHAEPVSAQRLAEVLEIAPSQVEDILWQLRQEYAAAEHGIALFCLEGNWQLATKSEYGEEVKKLMDKRRNAPLSQAALEVLAVIAYNQPVSRSFIEQVRGVDSSSTVSKLIEKGLIEEAGRLNLPGRPVSFRTTDVFLRTFGIESLRQLPDLHADSMNDELIEDEAPPAGEGAEP